MTNRTYKYFLLVAIIFFCLPAVSQTVITADTKIVATAKTAVVVESKPVGKPPVVVTPKTTEITATPATYVVARDVKIEIEDNISFTSTCNTDGTKTYVIYTQEPVK